MRSLVLSFVVCCIASSVTGELYRECKNFPVDNLEDIVKVSNCKATYCPLKKGTRTFVDMKFTPESQVNKIYNRVSADVGVLNLPFLGVDGTEANQLIFDADGKTHAKFPLEAGKEYLYKNAIDVLKLFPNIKVNVHWQLDQEGNKPVACFEVPARIVN